MGDFDGDGDDDVAMSAALSEGGRGEVYVVRSNGTKITAAGAVRYTSSLGRNQSGFYGISLAAGDFNGDGVADLAIGGPGRTVSGVARAGGVWLHPGDDGDGLQDAILIVDQAKMNPFYKETPEPSDAIWHFKWWAGFRQEGFGEGEHMGAAIAG